jgi:hypothetical protein
VDVVLGVRRHVEIEDVAHRRDVEAARRHVAGDQQRACCLETVERLHARSLVHVAVQRAGVEAVPLQRAGQRRHVALAVAEDDRVLEVVGAADQRAQRRALFLRLAAGRTSAASIVLAVEFGARTSILHRVGRNWSARRSDLGRHGGREEQRLPRERQQLADALDVGDEAHVEHAVGLVDDEDLDAGQQDLAALELVEQRPGVAIRTSAPRSSFLFWSSKRRRR